jgi:hypothetical protein
MPDLPHLRPVVVPLGQQKNPLPSTITDEVVARCPPIAEVTTKFDHQYYLIDNTGKKVQKL